MAGKGGLPKLDVAVLSAEHQEKLRQFKIKTRIDNEKYLRSHPEVELLIGDFLRDVLLKRPADICEFAAERHKMGKMVTAVPNEKRKPCGYCTVPCSHVRFRTNKTVKSH